LLSNKQVFLKDSSNAVILGPCY